MGVCVRDEKENGVFILFWYFCCHLYRPAVVLAAKVKVSDRAGKRIGDKNYIKLTWKKVPKARGYVVYRSQQYSGPVHQSKVNEKKLS